MEQIERYSVHIFWNEEEGEEGEFVVEFPDFPGLSAFGPTWEAALADARIVLDMALESCRDRGITPPEPKCSRPRRQGAGALAFAT